MSLILKQLWHNSFRERETETETDRESRGGGLLYTVHVYIHNIINKNANLCYYNVMYVYICTLFFEVYTCITCMYSMHCFLKSGILDLETMIILAITVYCMYANCYSVTVDRLHVHVHLPPTSAPCLKDSVYNIIFIHTYMYTTCTHTRLTISVQQRSSDGYLIFMVLKVIVIFPPFSSSEHAQITLKLLVNLNSFQWTADQETVARYQYGHECTCKRVITYL